MKINKETVEKISRKYKLFLIFFFIGIAIWVGWSIHAEVRTATLDYMVEFCNERNITIIQACGERFDWGSLDTVYGCDDPWCNYEGYCKKKDLSLNDCYGAFWSITRDLP